MSENINKRDAKKLLVESAISTLTELDQRGGSVSTERHKHLAAIERQKELDPAFGAAVAFMQEEWLMTANTNLKQLFDDAMKVNKHLMERIKETRTIDIGNGQTITVPALSSEEVVNILTAQRKLMVDVADQFRLAIGKPTSIHSNINKNDSPALSDEELDKRIKALSKHLNYIDVTPETPDAT
jgi:hypothetical protein